MVDTQNTHRPLIGRGVGIFITVAAVLLALVIVFAATYDEKHPRASSAAGTLSAPPASTEPLTAATPAEVVAKGPMPNAAQSSATGADAVHAFYSALGRGDGDKANSLMSLEKRAAPAYQPDAIEAFYGHMAEPLTLVSVSAAGANDYEVRYRYRKQSVVCNGHAIVTTQDSGSRALIARIKPIGNC